MDRKMSTVADKAPGSTATTDSSRPRRAAAADHILADPILASLAPTGCRSFTSIAIQSFALGFVLAGSLALIFLSLSSSANTFTDPSTSAWWRVPAFIACLTIFHFLEFYSTAAYNTAAARASSFLLYSNGQAYNVAHALATVEAIVSSAVPWWRELASVGGHVEARWRVCGGLAMVVLGQITRSAAMAHAASNFNHIPARTRQKGHELVTTGVYRWLRHPSYFGFFWWALGTQVLIGNKVCLVGYMVVLWWFFDRRIQGEPPSFPVRCFAWLSTDHWQGKRRVWWSSLATTTKHTDGEPSRAFHLFDDDDEEVEGLLDQFPAAFQLKCTSSLVDLFSVAVRRTKLEKRCVCLQYE